MKIPKKFKIGNLTIKVKFKTELLDECNIYGRCRYDKQDILLSNYSNNELLSEEHVLQTFYHEKIHHILNMMGENDLNKNEQFVDLFANFLLQTDLTAKYE